MAVFVCLVTFACSEAEGGGCLLAKKVGIKGNEQINIMAHPESWTLSLFMPFFSLPFSNLFLKKSWSPEQTLFLPEQNSLLFFRGWTKTLAFVRSGTDKSERSRGGTQATC